MAGFTTNVLRLVSGSIIAQALGIALIPIITRLYSPGDYGVFQLVLSISAILAILSCLSYQLAIMLPKDDEDSANIVVLCFILLSAFSAIIGGVFILLSGWVGKVLNVPDISQYTIFLPAIVFLNGLFLVMNYWLSRRVRFGVIASAHVANMFFGRIVQIGLGIGAASPLGLIAGLIVGYGTALLVMLRGIRDDLHLFKAVSPGDIKRLAFRYKRFPLFTSWSTLANSVSLQVAPLMLGLFFSPSVVGYYAMAHLVVNMPMSLIGSATSQVFFQKASEEKNRIGSVKTVVEEVHKRLVTIGIFPILVLMIMGEDLFALVLGSQWLVSGEYAQILAPWIFLNFIASPLSTIFIIFEKQTIDVLLNLFILLSRVAVLYVGGVYGDPVIALVLFSITGAVFWGLLNLYILKISGVPYKISINHLLESFLVALLAASPLIFVKYLSLSLYILLIVAGAVTLIYYSVVIFRDPVLKRELCMLLKGVGL